MYMMSAGIPSPVSLFENLSVSEIMKERLLRHVIQQEKKRKRKEEEERERREREKRV